MRRVWRAELRRRAATLGPQESANLDQTLKRESNTDVFQEEYPGQMGNATGKTDRPRPAAQ